MTSYADYVVVSISRHNGQPYEDITIIALNKSQPICQRRVKAGVTSVGDTISCIVTQYGPILPQDSPLIYLSDDTNSASSTSAAPSVTRVAYPVRFSFTVIEVFAPSSGADTTTVRLQHTPTGVTRFATVPASWYDDTALVGTVQIFTFVKGVGFVSAQE